VKNISWYSKNVLRETYIEELFNNLNVNCDVYVISTHPNELHLFNLKDDGKPKIVFDLNNEWHQDIFYHDRDDVLLILKEYAPKNLQRYKKVKPIPPIFNYGNWSGKTKTIEEKTSLFFSSMGFWPSRKKLKDVLSRYDNVDGFDIHWTKKFNTGFSYSEYMEHLTNSLISVSPQGYITIETSRTWELIIAKTIPICKKQIPYWYYQGMKLFEYKDESEIPEIIEHIISLDPKEQQSIVDLNKKVFEENVSPKAMASWIENKLKDIS